MSRSTSSTFQQNFKTDESVRCKFDATFYPAKILKIDNSGGSLSYLIHYQNWNKRFDEWVPANRLRKIGDEIDEKTKKSKIDVKMPKTSTPMPKKSGKSIQKSKIVPTSPSPIKKSPSLKKTLRKKETKSVNLPKPNLERIVEDDLVVYKTSNGKRFLTLDEIEQYCKSRKFDFQESDFNFLIPTTTTTPKKIAKKISIVEKSLPIREKSSAIKEKSSAIKEKSSAIKEKSLPIRDKSSPMKEKSSPILGKRQRKVNRKYAVEVTPMKDKKRRSKKTGRPLKTPKKVEKTPKKVEKTPKKVEKTPNKKKKTPKIDVSKKKRKSTNDFAPSKSKKPKLIEKTQIPEIGKPKLVKKRVKNRKTEIIPTPLTEQPVECVEVQETGGIGQMGSPIDERLPNLKILLTEKQQQQQQRKKTFSESSTSKLPDMTDTQHKGFSLGLYQSATSKLYAQQTQMKSGVYVQTPGKTKGFTLSPCASPPLSAAAAAAATSKRNFQPLRYDQHGLPIITDAEIEEGLRSVDAFKFSASNAAAARQDATSLMSAFSAAESLSSVGGALRSASSRRSGQRSLSGGGCGGGWSFESPERRRVARVSPRGGPENVESMEGDFSIPAESQFSTAAQYRRPTSFHQFSSASSTSYASSNAALAPHLNSPSPIFHYLPPEVSGDHCYGKNRSSTMSNNAQSSEQQRPLTVVTSLTTNRQQATSVRIQLAPAAPAMGSVDGDFGVNEQNRHASTLMSADISSPMLSGGTTSPLYQQQQAPQCRSPLYSTNPTAAPLSPIPNATAASTSSFAGSFEMMSLVAAGSSNVQSSAPAPISLTTTTSSSSASNRNLMPANILEGEDESDLLTPPTNVKNDDQSPEITSVIID